MPSSSPEANAIHTEAPVPLSSPHSSLTFLGTGTSVGVPVIGCDCEVCTSSDPRNTRLRSSVLLKHGSTTLLVDTGPDLRQQCLTHNITSVDAVLYTHEHLDHVVGFDEIRAFCWRRDDPLPLHATPDCMATLKKMFSWAFPDGIATHYKGYVRVDERLVTGPFEIDEIKITPLPVLHGSVTVIGYRFDMPNARSFCYIPDVKIVPDDTLPLLKGADLLVIDALGERNHRTHMDTEEAILIARRAGIPTTYFTHMGHRVLLPDAATGLPSGFHYAHDGLTLSLI